MKTLPISKLENFSRARENPIERPSEGNLDSAAQTPDVYYNNGPDIICGGRDFGSKKCSKEFGITWWNWFENSILVHSISLGNGPKLQILTISNWTKIAN